MRFSFGYTKGIKIIRQEKFANFSCSFSAIRDLIWRKDSFESVLDLSPLMMQYCEKFFILWNIHKHYSFNLNHVITLQYPDGSLYHERCEDESYDHWIGLSLEMKSLYKDLK